MSSVALRCRTRFRNPTPLQLAHAFGSCFHKGQGCAPTMEESSPIWATKVYQWLLNPQISKMLFRTRLWCSMMSLLFYLKFCSCLASTRIIPPVSDSPFFFFFCLASSAYSFNAGVLQASSFGFLTCDIIFSIKALSPLIKLEPHLCL